MPMFRAEIKNRNGSVSFDEFAADNPSEALGVAAKKYQGDFKEIRVPHLSPCQKLTEWLRKINERFEE